MCNHALPANNTETDTNNDNGNGNDNENEITLSGHVYNKQ